MNPAETKRAIQAALAAFATQPLAAAATALFEALGYRSGKRLSLDPNTPDNFLATFAQGRQLNAEHALLAQWQSVDFLFQLTDDEVRSAAGGNQQFLFDSRGTWDGAAMESYLFFAIELARPRHYSRTELSGITRAVNRLSDMPAMLLFRHGDTLTFAVINRRLHKRDQARDVLEKVTLIKDIRFASPHRAHVEILADLSFDSLRDRHDFSNFVTLHAAWQKSLDSSELNKRFFLEVANWYFWALNHIQFPKDAPKQDGEDHISVIRLITRLMFVWFVKEKGLVPDLLFDERKLPQILNGFSPDGGSPRPSDGRGARGEGSVFYRAILQNLFFATLNTEMDKRGWTREEQNFMAHSLYRFRELFQKPADALGLFKNIPFLNGGLFECLDKDLGEHAKPRYVRIDGFSRRADSQAVVPDFLFFGPEREVDLSSRYGDTKFKRVTVRGLIHTFQHYKFTITENTPIEEEIALDPELSGKVFENLLAAYNPETGATARKQTGSFFTPREIVNYMVDEALIAYLKTKLEAAHPSARDVEARLRHLFAYNDEKHQFTPQEVETLIAAIDSLKSIDPAVGSGAFPMGLLHKLVFILGKLDPRNEKWKERQVNRVREAMAAVEKIQDATVQENTLRELEQQIVGINEAFEHNELDYGRKLYLIENCIYGVDIQPIAVQIAKMRFFISLIADQKIDDAKPNRGIRPLPNLETKFVAANTLIGVNRPGQQMLRNRQIDAKEAELRRVRERHFMARTPASKAKCRDQDAKLRTVIAELLKGDGWDTATAHQLASWDPYDQNASAGFFDPEWMFGIVEGFDVTIGNPPYVRQEAIKEFKPVLQNQFQCYTGTADLLVYFYERGVKLLRPGGTIALITSNKFYRAGYGEKLRGFLARELTLHRLIDFGDAPVFDAIAYASILTGLRTKPTPEASALAYTWEKGMTFERIAEIVPERGQQIRQDELKTDGWRLESPATLRLLEKFRQVGKPLGEYVRGRFHNGVKSGHTKAFVVDQATRDRLVKEDKSSAGLFKPYLAGRDLKRWCVKSRGLWLIYLPWHFPLHEDTTITTASPKAEQQFKKLYPAIYKHLEQFKDELNGRDKAETGIRYEWYAMARPRFEIHTAFEQPKIILGRFMDKPTYAFDTEGFYHNDAQYLIGGANPYLVGILNSSVCWWFLTQICTDLQNGYLQALIEYQVQIPIPAVPSEKQKPVARLVDRILAAKQRDAKADVSALERAIDDLVYGLYGLTPEEIKIVESASVPTSARQAGAAK